MTSLRERAEWYWLSALVPVTATISFSLGRPWWFVVGAITLIPIAERLLGTDAGLHRRSGGCPAPVVPAAFIGLWCIVFATALERAQRATVLDFVGFSVATGMVSAFAMAHIHEVMHRRSRVAKTLADLACMLAGYPHYRSVHRLHHRFVGDPKYGSTAGIGTSVWRHVVTSFLSGVRAATIRPDREQTPVSYRRMLRPILIGLAVIIVVVLLGRAPGLVLFSGQCVISAFVVEVIGYIQHYGLVDVDSHDQIAWDVDNWFSNRLFVNNGFHTHHHMEQTRPYVSIEPIGVALPGGYIQLFLLTLLPPLWFALVDARVPCQKNTQ
ncbi:fatty acid desaturase [Burkholderia stagnalis]